MPRRLLTLGVLVALSVTIGSVLLRRAAQTDPRAPGVATDTLDLAIGSAPAVTTTSGAPTSVEQFVKLAARGAQARARIDYQLDGLAVRLVLAGPDARADTTERGRDVRVYGDALLGPTTVCERRPAGWHCGDVKPPAPPKGATASAGRTAASGPRPGAVPAGPDATDERRTARRAERFAPLFAPPDLGPALRRRLDLIARRMVADRAATCVRLRPGPRVGEREICLDDELGLVLSDLTVGGVRLEAVRLEPGVGIGEDDFIPPA